jgi:hypothetical protein
MLPIVAAMYYHEVVGGTIREHGGGHGKNGAPVIRLPSWPQIVLRMAARDIPDRGTRSLSSMCISRSLRPTLLEGPSSPRMVNS